jgi:cysteinyl-tRNA synthetase
MAEAHLGETIDIHAGGNDLLFPHHENEVAQSTCAHGGKVFARYWIHNGMLDMGGTKMSKSLGNVSVLHELLAKHPPEALRHALLGAQYRQPMEWSDAVIDQSIRTLDRLYGTLRDLADIPAQAGEVPKEIDAALCDDLNTPAALAELSGIAGEARKATSLEEKQRLKSRLLSAGAALGLLQQAPSEWFSRGGDSDEDARIQTLIDERNAAKTARDFARADAIRKQLGDEGVLIEDTAAGVRWRRS